MDTSSHPRRRLPLLAGAALAVAGCVLVTTVVAPDDGRVVLTPARVVTTPSLAPPSAAAARTPDAPLPTPPPAEGRVVRDRDEVVGRWTATQVRGGPVPPGARPGLSISRQGRSALVLSYDDGLNAISRRVGLAPDGRLVRGAVMTTLAGCAGPEGSCTQPSGFGVFGASTMRLTDRGDLVLAGPGGGALAVYEPGP